MNDHENIIPKVLRCLLQADPETGRWNGHCLDLDLATSGKDPDQAWLNLRAVVRLHVEHCFTHWQDGLKFRATPDEIAVFEALEKHQPVRREKMTFNLVPPQTREELPSLWIEAAEIDEGVGRGAPELAAVQ
jgi:hypothetical protein